jgi:hypothetical protein
MVDSDSLAARHCQKIVEPGKPGRISDGRSLKFEVIASPEVVTFSCGHPNGDRPRQQRTAIRVVFMSYVQPIQSSAEFKAVDLDADVRTLTSAGAVFRQGDNSNTDATTSSLSALLRRVFRQFDA